MSKFKFKPNKRSAKDGIQSGDTNGMRAKRGGAMFLGNPDCTGMNIAADDAFTAAGDAMADYFHFLDSRGLDAWAVLEMAMNHWENER